MTTSDGHGTGDLNFSSGTSSAPSGSTTSRCDEVVPEVWRRDYEGGIALVNAEATAQTVSLGGTFRKIDGTQDPSVNDGSLVTAVTLPPKDGIVLLREAAAPDTTPPSSDRLARRRHGGLRPRSASRQTPLTTSPSRESSSASTGSLSGVTRTLPTE